MGNHNLLLSPTHNRIKKKNIFVTFFKHFLRKLKFYICYWYKLFSDNNTDSNLIYNTKTTEKKYGKYGIQG